MSDLELRQRAQLDQVVAALSLLASAESAQRAHLAQLGALPSLDELGLEFDDILALSPS